MSNLRDLLCRGNGERSVVFRFFLPSGIVALGRTEAGACETGSLDGTNESMSGRESSDMSSSSSSEPLISIARSKVGFFAAGDVGEEGICGVELNGDRSLGVLIEGVGDVLAILVGGRAFIGEKEAMRAVRLLAVDPASFCANSVRVGVPVPENEDMC